MKKLLLAVLSMAVINAVSAQSALSPKEKKEGFVQLFDGKTTTGWHLFHGTGAGAWRVHDGILQLDTAAQGQGDLVTDNEYENYELRLDWRIPEGGNSGVIFSVNEDPKYAYTFLTGMEMQVLDDKGAEDNKQANHLAGSLYDMVAPAHPAKPAGKWNSIAIVKLHGHLTFYMNGRKVVEIQMGSPEWNALIQKSKFKNWKDFATYPKGKFALQDHGAAVAFRNIRIKQL